MGTLTVDNLNVNSTLTADGLGKVLQIQQTTKLDIVSTTTTSFHDITGLSVNITPSSTSSKILCFYNVCIGNSSTSNDALRLMRDSTSIFENSGFFFFISQILE